MRNDLDLSRMIAALDTEFSKAGIVVRQRHDVDVFHEVYGMLSGRQSPSPPISKDFVDIDPSNLFWIEATDTDSGSTVAVEAMKRETITTTLSRHLDQHYRRIYSGIIERHAPAGDMISGSIVYHGDLYVRESQRGKGLASKLSRLAILIATMRWNPDFIWGFIDHKKIMRGYGQKIGYWNSQPYGTQYSKEPVGISEKDWLVWMSRSDINYLIELHPRNKELTEN